MLIVAALQDEIRELKNRSAIDCTIHFKPATFYNARYFDKDFNLLVTGIGSARAKKGLKEAIGHQRPSSILFVGYAGGASPLAGLGCLVLAERVVDGFGEKEFASDKELLKIAKKLLEEKKIAHQVGGLVTVDRIVSDPHAKADLGAVHGALALDMEAAAIAEIASENKIPFLMVKSILDSVEITLPNLEDCIEPEGGTRPLMVMEHLIKSPGDVMKLPQLHYCATQARLSLAQFLEGWIQSV